MRNLKEKSVFLLAGALIFAVSLPALAQVPMQKQQSQQESAPDYSDEELESFVSTTQDVMEVRQGYQQKMVAAIEEEGLSPQEFQQMAQNQQSGKESDMSAEKQESFSNAMSEVMAIQEKMNTDVQSTVEENDMEMQEYQQMSMQIQQSPELSKKVNEMMQEGQGQRTPAQPQGQ